MNVSDQRELTAFRLAQVEEDEAQAVIDVSNAKDDEEGWVVKKVRFLPFTKDSVLFHGGTWFSYDEHRKNWKAVTPDA